MIRTMEEKSMKKRNVSIDVIIPLYKPDEKLNILLRRLACQTLVPRHVILLETVPDEDFFNEIKSSLVPEHVFFFKSAGVDTDDEFIRTLNLNLAAVKKSEFDHGGTRKYGASLSDADFIVFMTQDAVPAGKSLIERLSDSFINSESEKNAISYARQLPRKEADITERLTRLHNYPAEGCVKSSADLKKKGIQTYFCSDVCAMYDHKIFDSLGGFPEKTIFNEDMIMAAKVMDAGYTVTYCSAARVVHSHSYTCMQQFHRNFDLGVSHAQFPDIFKGVSSEKEGAGYAGKIIKYLLGKGHIFKCFYFCLQCGFKLFGYKAGKNYRKFPRFMVKAMSLNKGYWK